MAIVGRAALGLLCVAPQLCRAASSGGTRTVYIVRHAESRWNAAWKRLNVAAMMAERDHGLTVVGVDQSASLAGVLVGLPISLGAPGAILAASPLCRALQTAAIALCAAGVHSPSSILVLPDARESGGRLGFGRDSAGTPVDELVDNLVAELRGSGARVAASQLRRGELALDLRRLRALQCTGRSWWLPLESAADKRARLRRLLAELFQLASGGEDGVQPRVVLVSHSYVLRDLLLEHVDESAPFARSEARLALVRRSVPNCAVLALDLAVDVGGEASGVTARTRIVGAQVLASGAAAS
ncbi:hypothetical protein KFE25_013319 [Diacronema lutheri]|uniref:Phosphoglycerate mutase n=1 Tax=Diacronema lutheri TaxID=2081491 RepID=A0A8J5XG58_DIALT|nr:hypothetical protein KFE25_013319 [Diacronema lutheri]